MKPDIEVIAAPCPTEATPAALLVESDRLEESGWPEQAALMRDAAGKWEEARRLLYEAESRLMRSYDATEWPADGTSQQELTAAAIRDHLGADTQATERGR